jgi:ATP-dependent DNA ligase
MKLPIIYKLTQTGATQQWEIISKGNSFYTIEGQLDGKKTQSKPTICDGKNIGRSNETTPEEQAIKEAQAKWDKKIEEGYTEDINDIKTGKKFFAPMLAHKYLDFKDSIEFPVKVSAKIDGCRMIAKNDGLWTRNGKPYNSCPHIQKLLEPIFKAHPKWIIDGEIYSHAVPFEKVISVVKKTKPTKEDIEESAKIAQYYIFDGLVDDKTLGYESRFLIIQSEINKLVGKSNSIKFVESKDAESHKNIEQWHDFYVGQGYEGAMIRVGDSPYENKRSKNLLKFKKFLDEEFEIIAIVEGVGSRSGMAGNILLKTKDGKEFGAGIRGGEEYYKQLLKDKKKYIKKSATVRYQNLSEEEKIPRFPIVVAIDPIDR